MTHHPDMAGNRDGTFIGIYMMVNAIANFLGPLVAGYVLKIQLDPNAPTGDACTISTTEYENDGCELTGIDYWMPCMLGTVSLALAVNVYYQEHIVNYCNTDRRMSTTGVADWGGNTGAAGRCTNTDTDTDTDTNTGRETELPVTEF